MKVRRAAYAGMFYEGQAEPLRNQIRDCFNHRLGPGSLPNTVHSELKNIVGLISPHAGYMYSGPVAAHGYHYLALDGKPDVVVVLGPNHTGAGSGLALMREGMWSTPLGQVMIDSAVADAIVGQSEIIDVDETAHMREHSIEVQLPWLQFLYGSSFKFVPICFMMQDFESSKDVGTSTAKALKGRNALVIASTDMTHYESQRMAESKDKLVLQAASNLDERAMYSAIERLHVSMCGYGPVVAAITAAKELGAETGKLVCYKTSGDIVGDYSAVVGYASLIITR